MNGFLHFWVAGDVKPVAARRVPATVRAASDRSRGAAPVKKAEAGVEDSSALVKRLRAELAESKEKVAELEAERAAGSLVVMVRPGVVTFRNGLSFRVGEVLDGGPFVGRHVARVDCERREVHLDDGTVLRMSGGPAEW